jgi:omega-amidase
MRVLVVQNRVRPKSDKMENAFFALKQARLQIARNNSSPVDLVVFGEMFANPYSPESFIANAEEIPEVGHRPPYVKNSLVHALSAFALEQQALVVGGSISEKRGERYYNTSLMFDMEGNIVGKYRKMHLFDVNVKATGNFAGITFKESEVFTKGDLGSCWVDCGPYGKIGVGICYDMRFPELTVSLTQESLGLSILIYVVAFAASTGTAHQELLARARAIDAQAFVVVASTARSAENKDFQVYGHSMIVSPWGEVIEKLDESPGTIDKEIAVEIASDVQRQLPLRRRFAVNEIRT